MNNAKLVKGHRWTTAASPELLSAGKTKYVNLKESFGLNSQHHKINTSKLAPTTYPK